MGWYSLAGSQGRAAGMLALMPRLFQSLQRFSPEVSRCAFYSRIGTGAACMQDGSSRASGCCCRLHFKQAAPDLSGCTQVAWI